MCIYLQNFNNMNWKIISHVSYVYTCFVNCIHVLVACQLSLNSSTDSWFMPTLTRHAQCTDITLCKKRFAIMVEATLTRELAFKVHWVILSACKILHTAQVNSCMSGTLWCAASVISITKTLLLSILNMLNCVLFWALNTLTSFSQALS